jgi:hypothetical protein
MSLLRTGAYQERAEPWLFSASAGAPTRATGLPGAFLCVPDLTAARIDIALFSMIGFAAAALANRRPGRPCRLSLVNWERGRLRFTVQPEGAA